MDGYRQAKYIKSWEELSKETSPTHILEIDVEGCNGWIHPKKDDGYSLVGHYYLSTHTFYGSRYKWSTWTLQSCGFNVELANWDEKE